MLSFLSHRPLGRNHRRDRGLRRFSVFLAVTSLAVAGMLPAALVWAAFSGGISDHLASRLHMDPTALAPWQWALTGCLVMAPVICIAAALVAASRCFFAFGSGQYFQVGVVTALRAFGARVALAAIIALLTPTLLGLVALGSSTGNHALVVELNSNQLLGLLFGGIVWAIGGVMARAVDMADYNAQIV
ncbi:MAG: hypothetical protein AAGD34_08215 [Pseudomonadota bacterium]